MRYGIRVYRIPRESVGRSPLESPRLSPRHDPPSDSVPRFRGVTLFGRPPTGAVRLLTMTLPRKGRGTYPATQKSINVTVHLEAALI